MKPFQFFSFLLCFTSLLMGCAKEPSNEDVVKIISNTIKEDTANVIDKKFLGVNMGSVLGIDQLKINAIEKIACEPIVNKKITCQVLVDFEFVNKKDGLIELLGGVPKTKKVVEYQFVQTSKGWQVLDPVVQK